MSSQHKKWIIIKEQPLFMKRTMGKRKCYTCFPVANPIFHYKLYQYHKTQDASEVFKIKGGLLRTYRHKIYFF